MYLFDLNQRKVGPESLVIGRYPKYLPVSREASLTGFAREETIRDWTKEGQWKRVDIYTQFYKIGKTTYEVPPHYCLKGIILEKENLTLLRLITREAKGYERRVSKRFLLMGRKK